MEKVELLILKNLIYNEDFVRKILPYLKCEYFQDYSQKVVFEEIQEFFSSYNQLPTKEAIEIEVENRTDLTEESFKNCLAITSGLEYEPVEDEWLFSTTEKWCKDRAVYLALMEAIHVADGGDSKRNRDAIPSILQEALSVSFDTRIGHDYIEDVEERYEFYHKKDLKIPFDVDYLNRITDGGVSRKTLNLFVATTGGGKSLFLCHVSSSILLQGKNVLYITLEMSEEKIAERIDANLLDVSIQDIKKLSKEQFLSKATQLSRKTQGKLIIREYPPGSANINHFKALLKELEMKKNFVPDAIVIDYLNICASSRYKTSTSNSYTYVKSIAEELRAMGVEYNVPIYSSCQFNRSGSSNSDASLEDTSDSFGIAYTADLLLAIISTEELEQMNQILIKQLKNRYAPLDRYRKFVVGVDRSKMRVYNVDQSAQEELIENKIVDNNSSDLKSKFKTINFN
jgi:archaellum biogenesis ATPase FlaH